MYIASVSGNRPWRHCNPAGPTFTALHFSGPCVPGSAVSPAASGTRDHDFLRSIAPDGCWRACRLKRTRREVCPVESPGRQASRLSRLGAAAAGAWQAASPGAGGRAAGTIPRGATPWPSWELEGPGRASGGSCRSRNRAARPSIAWAPIAGGQRWIAGGSARHPRRTPPQRLLSPPGPLAI
jgi:hypothetical protein